MGALQVKVPFEMQVFEGATLVGVTSNKLPLPPGPHDLRIVSETLAFETRLHAEIFVGKTTRLPVALPKGSISLNATPWAEVWIDGEKVGETPIGNYARHDRPARGRVQEPRSRRAAPRGDGDGRDAGETQRRSDEAAIAPRPRTCNG